MRSFIIVAMSASMKPALATAWVRCGRFNSDDCVSEWKNAKQNGDFGGFCSRCAGEGGFFPIRDRCQLCCKTCVQADVAPELAAPPPPPEDSEDPARLLALSPAKWDDCGRFNSDDCVSEWKNAKQNGDFGGFCSRCDGEGGFFPIRDRCQLCCKTCVQADVAPELAAPPAPEDPARRLLMV